MSLGPTEQVRGRQLLSFQDVGVGQVFHASECFDGEALESFRRVSGDSSALHTDDAVARRYGFPARLVYGFHMLALLSRIVGAHFRDAVCASVSVDFARPVPCGETVRVVAEVKQIQPALRCVALKVRFYCKAGLVARGRLTAAFLASADVNGSAGKHEAAE